MNGSYRTPESVRLGLQKKLNLCLPDVTPPAEMYQQIWRQIRRKESNVRYLGTSYFRGNMKMRAFIDLTEEEE